MVARAHTVAFQGVDARPVEVQCAVSPGLPAFSIVGLPDKAVSEARDRVRSALSSMAIALPSKRITINLSPADLPKEGSHFDLPIAVALLSALDIIPSDAAEGAVSLGELSLDGSLVPVVGALPAAMTAAAEDRTLLCPRASSAEAAWVDATQVIGAGSLGDVVRHFSGQSPLPAAQPGEVNLAPSARDLRDVKGQERAKRALEIAAAGRHHLIMIGTPGSGKSMLAARLPGILPPLTPTEALETSMIQSLCGLLDEGGISRSRPFREPHHTASMAAIVGGGCKTRKRNRKSARGVERISYSGRLVAKITGTHRSPVSISPRAHTLLFWLKRYKKIMEAIKKKPSCFQLAKLATLFGKHREPPTGAHQSSRSEFEIHAAKGNEGEISPAMRLSNRCRCNDNPFEFGEAQAHESRRHFHLKAEEGVGSAPWSCAVLVTCLHCKTVMGSYCGPNLCESAFYKALSKAMESRSKGETVVLSIEM